MTRRFTDEPASVILDELAHRLRGIEAGQTIDFEVLDPDVSAHHYPGERLEIDQQTLIYRPYTSWCDLAERLGCVVGTPRPLSTAQDDRGAAHFVRIPFRKLDATRTWPTGAAPSGDPERYGQGSQFARIDKFEEPRFLADYLTAVKGMALPEGARVLALGVNSGGELGILESLFDPTTWATMELVGIDHSASAIARGRERYSGPQFRFIEADLARLGDLALGRFDLVVALNTLHSPALDGHGVFRQVLSDILSPSGGMILGFPNCRYVDHALVYGARQKGIPGTELSVVVKDLKYYKRVLHQRGFRVRLTGKYTLVLSAKRPRSTAPR